ncbi:MAG TPA: class I SAM-dependent methyltransferase, partial [Solirubrobacterales bacterium]|nr:class I SAM-dependent methyltransferase [Solirubrobacterales bacterium]
MNATAGTARFVPAAGRRGLTRFYDATVALTMREETFRGRLASQALAGIGPGAHIVEVGTGTGTLAIAMAAAAPSARVSGIDPDPEALAIARSKDGAGAVSWHEGLAADLPFPDEGCDRVVMSLLLHHLDADAKRSALAEA